MDEAEKPNQERKIWQGPIKHVGLGASAMAAMLWLTPMKNVFYTREEGAANKAQIEEIKGLITTGFATQKADMFAHATEETHKHERMVDTMRDELKAEKDDRIREIELVENLFKINKNKTN